MSFTFGRSDIEGSYYLDQAIVDLIEGIVWPPNGGTSYSYVYQIAIEVTTAASPATTISNAKFGLSTDLPDGWAIFFKGNPTYLDQTVMSQGPPDVLTDNLGQPATPAGYALATLVPAVWDVMGTVGNGGVLGRRSIFLDLVLGLSSTSIWQGSRGITPGQFYGVITYDETT